MASRSLIGFLQNFGGGEILVILLAALVILGPDRLPEMARSLGKLIHRARSMTTDMQSQVRDVIDDPAMKSIKELGQFAARPRQKLAEYALEAEAEARAAETSTAPTPAAGDAPADPAPVAAPDATVSRPSVSGPLDAGPLDARTD